MATEDILIRYRADVSQLEADLNKLVDSQEQLTAATKQNTAEQTKAANSAEFAAKKRAQLLDQETKKLQQLKEAQKLAFDPVIIDKYNQQIAASQKRIETLGGTYKQAAQQAQDGNQQLLGGLTKIAGAFGVAFSVEALINFGKQAVSAFLAAEETANKLRFAIVNIGGEGEEALAALNAQAEKLAEITFFGDDDIKSAQAALSAFGLTAKQIEETIPTLLDYAARTGDLQGAVNAVGGALEGRAGEFKNYGLQVDAAATKSENLANVQKVLARETGAAGDALKTASGQAKDAQDQLGEFVESIGQGIVVYFQDLFKVLGDIIGPVVENLKKIGRAFIDLIPDSIIKKLGELTDGFNLVQTAFKIGFAPLRAVAEVLNFLYETVIKGIPYIVGFVNVVRDGFGEVRDLASSLGDGIANLFQGITEFDTAKLKAGVNKLKTGFQNIGFDVAKSFNEGFQRGQAALNVGDQVEEAQIKLTDNLLKSDELRKKSLTELRALQLQYAKDQTNEGRQNLEAIQKEIKAQEEAAKAAQKAAEEAKKQAEEVKKLIDSIDAEIAKLEADLAKRKIEIIPAKSQQEQIQRVQQLADLNEQAISDEIAGKIKLVQEDTKLSEKQKQEVIKKYEELKQARLNFAQFNEQNELNLINADQVRRIEEAAKQLDDLGIEQALTIQSDKIETANDAVAKSFEDLAEAVTKADFETAKEAATQRTETLNQEIQNEQNLNVTRINNAREAELAKVKDGEAAAAERAAINQKYDNQITNSDKAAKDKIAKNNENLTTTIEDQEKASYDRRVQQTLEYAQAASSVLKELGNLFSQITEKQIEDATSEKEARLTNIDEIEARQQEAFEQGLLSEAEFKAVQDENRNARINAEVAAEKKIREAKKKQALLDKANAIFEIAINTAQNIVGQPGPFGSLIPFWVALGGLQTAAVIAQPVAYAQGTKDSGDNGQMARVGEHGEEMVWMPAGSKVLPARQTRKYADIIDAMYDNKLDDYVYKNYITPALLAQKEAKDKQKSKTFAENMANSIVYNQQGLTPSDLESQRKRGQYIRNVDEIASAIAKQLPKYDPYRS